MFFLILFFIFQLLRFFAISLAKQKIEKINVLQLLQKSIIYYNYLLQINTLINKICGNL